jgi:CubicO group peptidase (beta-lactamase class C family)
MRFLFVLAGLCAMLLFAPLIAPLIAPFGTLFGAMAQTPDAAPSTPVDTVEMLAFEPTREEAVLEAFIDGVAAAHMREHDIPGVSLSVVQNGRILFAKGYGFADVEEKTPVSGQDTLFRIGSVSKTFIWTAVTMLAERGQINLEADVNVYLKGLQIPDTFDAPITMNDLMAHRAGFEDTLAVFTLSDESPLSLTQALAAHMPKRVYPPGARTSYSNWGAALAAKIVEDVSGVSYEQFLQDEILTPLALTRTTLKGPSIMDARLRAQLADSLRIENRWPAATDYMGIGPYAPAGAMASSADDMARWMLFHLGGGEHDGVRLMSRQSHDQMWSRAFKDRPYGADVAHGFMTKTYRGYKTFGHGGATSAFYTNMVLVPELGVGVFVSQNTTADRTFVSELPDLIIDRLAAPGRIPGEMDAGEALAEKAADYAGTYLQNRRSFSKFEKFFSVGSVAKVTPGEDGALLVASNGAAVRYVPLKSVNDVYQDHYGNRIVFGRNQKGAVTHFTDASGVHSYDRVGGLENPNTLFLAFGVAMLFSITTWFGAWRRQGRAGVNTAIGSILGLTGFAAAGLTFAFTGAVIWVLSVLSGASAADLLNYPPLAVTVFRVIASTLFIAAFVMLASLWLAWRASGWSVWRKMHHSAFALSLAALALLLVQWKVIFSATV